MYASEQSQMHAEAIVLHACYHWHATIESHIEPKLRVLQPVTPCKGRVGHDISSKLTKTDKAVPAAILTFRMWPPYLKIAVMRYGGPSGMWHKQTTQTNPTVNIRTTGCPLLA